MYIHTYIYCNVRHICVFININTYVHINNRYNKQIEIIYIKLNIAKINTVNHISFIFNYNIMQNTFNSQNAIILKMHKYLNTIYLNVAHKSK